MSGGFALTGYVRRTFSLGIARRGRARKTVLPGMCLLVSSVSCSKCGSTDIRKSGGATAWQSPRKCLGRFSISPDLYAEARTDVIVFGIERCPVFRVKQDRVRTQMMDNNV